MKRFCGWMLCLICLLALCGPCLAEESGPVMITPPPDVDQSAYQLFPYETSAIVINLKARLIQYGYYDSFYIEDSSVLSSNVYDDLAMAAVRECCTRNNLETSPYGLLTSTYSKIINGEIVNLIPEATEEPEFHHILWGETGAAVGSLQAKLIELGYMDNYDMDNAIGVPVYGEQMREGLSAFLKNNNLANYDQSTAGNDEYKNKGGITPDLQEFMLKTENLHAAPTPTPSPEPEATEAPEEDKGSWMTRPGLLGLPNIVGIGIGAVLLAVIAFLALRFLRGAEQDKDENGNRKSVIIRPIKFTISYKGHVQDYSAVVSKVLRIGRNVGSFPLNMEDLSISKRHCEIYYLNNQLMLTDYSANGTMVNSQLVHNGKCKLSNGDRLQVGSHIITISF